MAGWISCSSRMPLPLASSRAIERLTTSLAVMCFQSSATTSALQVTMPRERRYFSTMSARSSPGMRKKGATASILRSALRVEAKP